MLSALHCTPIWFCQYIFRFGAPFFIVAHHDPAFPAAVFPFPHHAVIGWMPLYLECSADFRPRQHKYDSQFLHQD